MSVRLWLRKVQNFPLMTSGEMVNKIIEHFRWNNVEYLVEEVTPGQFVCLTWCYGLNRSGKNFIIVSSSPDNFIDPVDAIHSCDIKFIIDAYEVLGIDPSHLALALEIMEHPAVHSIKN